MSKYGGMAVAWMNMIDVGVLLGYEGNIIVYAVYRQLEGIFTVLEFVSIVLEVINSAESVKKHLRSVATT